MALTNCPECGGQVSTAAASCPHCGFTPYRQAPPQQVNHSGNFSHQHQHSSEAQAADELRHLGVRPRACWRAPADDHRRAVEDVRADVGNGRRSALHCQSPDSVLPCTT